MIDLTKYENWDKPLFPLVVVAQAACIPATTLRKWITRFGDELKLWQGDAASGRAEASGFAHRFSLRDALHVAAAARLTAKGVPVKDAYAASIRWVHFGDFFPPASWANEPAPELVREPGGLFADPAWTFLIHSGGDSSRVVSVTRDGSKLPFEFSDLFASGHPVRTAPTIVFLNSVDHYVRGVCEGYLREDSPPVWDDAAIQQLIDGN